MLKCKLVRAYVQYNATVTHSNMLTHNTKNKLNCNKIRWLQCAVRGVGLFFFSSLFQRQLVARKANIFGFKNNPSTWNKYKNVFFCILNTKNHFKW